MSCRATAAACGFAEVIVDTYSRHEGPIRVHWLPHEALPLPGRLGMTIIPGRKWRDAARDLDDLRAAGVRRLLCLANDQELFECGIRNLRALSEERGIVFHHVPVFFHSTPSVDQVRVVPFLSVCGVCRVVSCRVRTMADSGGTVSRPRRW